MRFRSFPTLIVAALAVSSASAAELSEGFEDVPNLFASGGWGRQSSSFITFLSQALPR